MSNDDDSKDSWNCKKHENTKMIFIVHITTFKLTLFKREWRKEEAKFFFLNYNRQMESFEISKIVN